ncbi:MAG: Catalase [Myxococcaceae bacterium]|nr:Catalase [Myxococcaceae bacterium]
MASTDWKESIAPGEAEHLEALAAQLHAIQRARAARTGLPADRALHAKGNAGLSAELVVRDDVPAALRVGIFAKAATYRAYARYSNGSGGRADDRKGDVRGLAVKLVGVPGKKLIPGLDDAVTQDFLLIRTPTTPMRTAAEFIAIVDAAQSPALLPFRLMGKLGIGRTFQILRKAVPGLNKPVMPLAATTYFTAVPVMWGAHAVKLSLVARDAAPAQAPKRTSPNGLGDELAARLAQGPVIYDLCAQLFVDEASTPIEDPSVEWTDAVAPPHKIAELTIAKQDPSSARGKKLAAFVETLSFDPWHAPVEFRPLGELMRARNPAYRLSTKERLAAPEPDGTESFD